MNDTNLISHRLLTVREVSEQLRVGEATIYRWCRAGFLPTVRPGPGATVRIPAKALIDQLARSAERRPGS